MEKITKTPPPVPSKSFIAKRPGNPPAGAPAGHAESPVEKKDAFEAPKATPWEARMGPPLGRRRSGDYLADCIKQAKERPRKPPGTTAPRSAEEIAAFLDAMRSA
jgi:hypothetical protein